MRSERPKKTFFSEDADLALERLGFWVGEALQHGWYVGALPCAEIYLSESARGERDEEREAVVDLAVETIRAAGFIARVAERYSDDSDDDIQVTIYGYSP